MMNKLFEVIEAKKIFNIPYKKIKILIHPKSYIHAIIKFNSGIIKILAHEPNMKIPIYNSIYFNQNSYLKTNKLNLNILNDLNIKAANYKKFKLLNILNKLPNNETLFETVLITINDFFVSKYLKEEINYKELIFFINKYSNNKIFQSFKKKVPKKINDVLYAKNFVYTKLNNWSIKQ